MKTKAFFVSLALLASFGPYGNVATAATTVTLSDLTPAGSAAFVDGGLRLTANEQWQTGGAFNTTPIDITHFHANFSFEYTGSSPDWNNRSADGLVFVIKSAESTGDGALGGGMGYYKGVETYSGNTYTHQGISKSVGIEFDNFGNGSQKYGDPDDKGVGGVNHIDIGLNGLPVESTASVPVNTQFNGSGTWYAWVDYNGTTMTVSTGLDPDKSNATAVLSYGDSNNPFVITSSDYVGSTTGLVGFTAGTGLAAQNHVVTSFNYSPNPEPSAYVLMGIGALIAVVVARRKMVLSNECYVGRGLMA